MSWKSGLTSPGSRARVVGGLLVLTLALAAVLAYQVVDANRSHERVARKTAGEQAAVAAWAFSQAARKTLADKLFLPGTDVTARAGGTTPGAPMTWDVFLSKAVEKEWSQAEGVVFGFRMDLPAVHISYFGNPPAGIDAWLKKSLLPRSDSLPGTAWSPAVVFPPGSKNPVAYVNDVDDQENTRGVYGVMFHSAALDMPFEYAFTDFPLLPPTLTGRFENQALFAVRVLTADGDVLCEHGPSTPSEFIATDTLGASFGGMVAEVRIRPDLAEMLVVGGFPRSRLPQVVGLLALASLLVVAAIFQLKREGELAQLRADFVSGVSHELRTPLAQIRMFSETLLLGRVRSEEERERSLEIIVHESQRLSHQLDNVLLFSRGERGRLQMKRSMTDLSEFLAEVLEGFRPLAEAAGVSVELETSNGIVANVDPMGLRQAVLNLLDNAVKYGPAGQKILVGVSRLPAGKVLLWVEDEGPGVPADARESIFEPYHRLQDHRESAVAGSGIGLAVVRRIAEQHDGSVRVESVNGKGARFVMELPMDLDGGGSEGES